jgi:hypothetical protein
MTIIEGNAQRYDADVLFNMLPSDYLLKERALIFAILK